MSPKCDAGATSNLCSGRSRFRADLPLVLVCLAFVGGCGSTATMVKESLDYRPAVVNAFSRAVSLGFGNKNPSPAASSSAPSKQTAGSFEHLPRDENSPRVRQFVRHYAYGQRETMKSYLARVEPYLAMVKTAAREHALPEDIAYLVMLESGADPEARSPANALGMWQFMPATARSYGLRVDSWVDERLDPWKSTKAAMLYLKDLYGMFGCWRLALSAYNSGENKLNKVLCQEDATEYDEISSSRRLKRETREFFPRFLAMTVIAKNPGKYGFNQVNESAKEDKHELVPVEGCYALESLAQAAGVPRSTLAGLNPALVRGKTPAEGSPYALRVPLGKKQILARKLEDIPEDRAGGHVVHVVSRGDNLARILKRYHVEKTRLAELNPDVNFRKRLRRGSKIVIPVEKTQTGKTMKGRRLSMDRAGRLPVVR